MVTTKPPRFLLRVWTFLYLIASGELIPLAYLTPPPALPETGRIIFYENHVVDRIDYISSLPPQSLSIFCGKIAFLLQKWRYENEISEQLKSDEINCFQAMGKYPNLEFNYGFYNLRPIIIPSGELLFIPGQVTYRDSLLQALPTGVLQRHCEKVDRILLHYDDIWRIKEQVDYDKTVCTRLGFGAYVWTTETSQQSSTAEPFPSAHATRSATATSVTEFTSTLLPTPSSTAVRNVSTTSTPIDRHNASTHNNSSLLTRIELETIRSTFTHAYRNKRQHEIRRINVRLVKAHCEFVELLLLKFQEEWSQEAVMTPVLDELVSDKSLCDIVKTCLLNQTHCDIARPCQTGINYSNTTSCNDDYEGDDDTCLLCAVGLIIAGVFFALGVTLTASVLAAAGVAGVVKYHQGKRMKQRRTTKSTQKTTTTTTTTTSSTTTSTTTESPTTETTTEEPTTSTTEATEDACPYEPLVDYDFIEHQPSATLLDLLNITQSSRRGARTPGTSTIASPFPGKGDCRIFFNEFSTDNPGQDSSEFIEYKKACTSGPNRGGRFAGPKSQVGFVSLFVSGFSASVTSVFVHKGEFRKVGGDWLYVVGSHDSPSAQEYFGSTNAQHASRGGDGYLDNGNTHPSAMILLYSSEISSLLRAFTLPGWKWVGTNSQRDYTRSTGPLKLTPILLQKIRDTLQDLVVYGGKLETDRCDVFENIWEPFKKDMLADYTLRDWESDVAEGSDFSLNRCVTHTKPICPDCWKIGNPTPGEPNDCSHAVKFVVAQNLQKLKAGATPQLQHQQPCSSAHASRTTYRSVSQANYQAAVVFEVEQAALSPCAAGTNPQLATGETLTQLHKLKGLLDVYKVSKVYPWLNTDRFTNEKRTFLQDFLSVVLDIDFMLSDQITPWLEVNPNEAEPRNTTFMCIFCEGFRENSNRFDRPSSGLITAIMTTEGYRMNTGTRAKSVNKNYFLAHLQNRLHLDAVNWLMEQVGVRVLKDLNTALMEQVPAQSRHWISTINFFEQVVLMSKLNIPIQSVPKILDQQVKYGAPLGYLYRNRKGVTNVIYEVGIVQHDLTLEALLEEDVPVTLILDGSTLSSTGMHFVITYFQTIIKGVTTLLHYRLIPLGTDLTGVGHWNAIRKFLESESHMLREFLQRNLVAVVSDGAAVMTSTFMAEVRKFTSRPTINIWCLAHKMDLGFKHAEKGREPFQNVVSLVNRLHSYFTTSPKRGASLRERGRREGFVVRQIPRIISVRWVATQHAGLDVLYEMYEVIVRELKEYTSTLRGEKLQTALELHDALTSTSFVSNLAFIVDVTAHLAAIAGSLQRQGTLVISNIDVRNKLLFVARNLYTRNGPTLRVMLEEATCSNLARNAASQPGCTLEQFENENVLYKGFNLRTSRTNMLRDERKPFLDEFIKQINFYFPVDVYEKYFIFSPSIIQTAHEGIEDSDDEDILFQQQLLTGFIKPSSVKQFGVNAIQYFAEQTGWFASHEAQTVVREWNTLVESILADPFFPDLKTASPEVFWTNALRNPFYKWTSRTRKIVSSVLTIGATSVEAERGFSDLGWLTGKKRTRLDWTTLDHYLRIRYNIPDDLSQWNSVYYIMSWLSHGHCLVDDASCVKPRGEQPEVEDRYLQNLNIVAKTSKIAAFKNTLGVQPKIRHQRRSHLEL